MDKEYTLTDKTNPKFVKTITYTSDSYDPVMHKGLKSDEDKLYGFLAGKLAEDFHVDDVETVSEVYVINDLEYGAKCIDGEDDEYSRTLIYKLEVDGTNINFTQSVKY